MNDQKTVKVCDIEINNNKKIVLIAGPCQIESLDHCLFLCEEILKITSDLNIPFIFKASYDKANRSSLNSKRGVGIIKGLEILNKIRKKLNVPVLTDIHETYQANIVKDYVDVIQIPAFLCRQTDLILAASETGLPLNIKKGQFLAPWDVKNIIEKAISTGNNNVMICERGTSFGYNNLINDFKGLPIMKSYGYPVIFDATHSVQIPGGKGNSSSGNSEFVEFLSRAAVAVGVAGLFLEVHEEPKRSPSDGDNMVELSKLRNILELIYMIDEIVKGKENEPRHTS